MSSSSFLVVSLWSMHSIMSLANSDSSNFSFSNLIFFFWLQWLRLLSSSSLAFLFCSCFSSYSLWPSWFHIIFVLSLQILVGGFFFFFFSISQLVLSVCLYWPLGIQCLPVLITWGREGWRRIWITEFVGSPWGQWLRISLANARGTGSIPGLGRFHMPGSN